MKRIILGVGCLAILAATACQPTQFEDVEMVEQGDEATNLVAEVRDPDSITVYRNVDRFANINVMCVNGNAFITRSSNWGDWQPLYLAAGTHNLCDS